MSLKKLYEAKRVVKSWFMIFLVTQSVVISWTFFLLLIVFEEKKWEGMGGGYRAFRDDGGPGRLHDLWLKTRVIKRCKIFMARITKHRSDGPWIPWRKFLNKAKGKTETRDDPDYPKIVTQRFTRKFKKKQLFSNAQWLSEWLPDSDTAKQFTEILIRII